MMAVLLTLLLLEQHSLFMSNPLKLVWNLEPCSNGVNTKYYLGIHKLHRVGSLGLRSSIRLAHLPCAVKVIMSADKKDKATVLWLESAGSVGSLSVSPLDCLGNVTLIARFDVLKCEILLMLCISADFFVEEANACIASFAEILRN